MRAPSLGGIVGPQTSTLEEAGLLQMSALGQNDRPLPQRDDQSVEVGGNNQPDLAARQSQHRAVLVG
jgi:hypothetical protein